MTDFIFAATFIALGVAIGLTVRIYRLQLQQTINILDQRDNLVSARINERNAAENARIANLVHQERLLLRRTKHEPRGAYERLMEGGRKSC